MALFSESFKPLALSAGYGEQSGVMDLLQSNVGYGTDPNLINPVRTWKLTLSKRNRIIAGLLADTILPAVTGYPAPTQNGFVDFIDEWLSAPYPTQQQHKLLALAGFATVEGKSIEMFGKRFRKLNEEQRHAVVATLTATKFFQLFRYLTLGSYFSSSTGWRALQYLGNVPLNTAPTLSKEVRDAIEFELQKLGL